MTDHDLQRALHLIVELISLQMRQHMRMLLKHSSTEDRPGHCCYFTRLTEHF
jgi:hypothetical protein